MEDFLLYILKSAGISTLFLLCYTVFLKKETFFNHNRVFLLTGLVLSFIIPLISIKEIVWLKPTILPSNNSTGLLDPNLKGALELNWISIVSTVYILGTVFIFIRLLVNLISLKKIIVKGDNQKEGGISFVETQKNTNPFSFFNYLIYNPENLSKSDFATIVAHERIHINGLHSLDMLLMHAVLLVQWFNPFIWFYKDSIEHNLEFIADQGALKSGRDKIGYQNLMLKTTVGATHPYFSNSFYNSIIKKRIVMLNKQKSQKNRLWKFGTIFPLLLVFIFSFQTTTVAQVKVTGYDGSIDKPVSIRSNSQEKPLVVIDGIVKKDASISNLGMAPEQIESINVLKGELALQKYGAKGSNGVIEITTKKHKGLKNNGTTTENGSSSIKVREKINVVALQSSSGEKPLIVINGIEHPKADMDNLGLEPEEIESINVLKDALALKKYGAKGKNGVVEITTKKKK